MNRGFFGAKRLLSVILSLKMSNWTNKKSKIVLQIYWKFYHGSAKIKNLDFQTGSLVLREIRLWSGQAFTNGHSSFSENVQLNKQTNLQDFLKFWKGFSRIVKKLRTGIFRPGSLVLREIRLWSWQAFTNGHMHNISQHVCIWSSIVLSAQ